jgi:hypothetical protein
LRDWERHTSILANNIKVNIKKKGYKDMYCLRFVCVHAYICVSLDCVQVALLF